MKRIIIAATLAVGLIGGTASAAPGPNVILGTVGPDKLVGTQHPDIIYGFGSPDVLIGGRGNDILRGGTGADRLWDFGAHSGSDRLNGGPGPKVDRCVGDASDVFVNCEIIRIR